MYPELAVDRSWYSVSLPFHYPSTFSGKVTDEALDEHILAELFHRVVNEFLPSGDFHLVGYSVGGFAAMNYAAKFPRRVLSVVSVGGFVAGRTFGLEGALEFIAQGNFLRKAAFHTGYWLLKRHRFFYKMATLSYARRWLYLLRYPDLDPTIRNVFPDVKHHPIAGQRAWGRFLLGMNLLDELDRIECPVLVIAGNRDPVIPYEHQKTYSELLPDATLVTLAGGGHVAFGEAAEAFETYLLSWFREK